MNDVCTEIFQQLDSEEFIDFVRNCFSYVNFKTRHGNDLIEYANTRKTNEPKIIAYIYLNKVKNKVHRIPVEIRIDDNGNKKLCYGETSYNIIDYLKDNSINDIETFYLLSISMKERPDLRNIQIIKEKSQEIFNDLSDFDIEEFSFIIGSGIDYDFNVVSWKNLLKIFEGMTETEFSILTPELEKFSEDMCNTNYYIPQMYKDVQYNNYFDIIYHSLYDLYNIDDSNIYLNPCLSKYNLFQIANIISYQYKFKVQEVITFNYDTILEDILNNSFCIKAKTVYKGNSKSDSQVNIIHTHGCIPNRVPILKTYKQSVVLSHQEYLNAYKNPTSFAYKKLYRQLDKVNLIIGNSLSDYEEQKVFYNHHRRYINKFSFALVERLPRSILNAYKTYSLLRIGVIPIFFNNTNEMGEFLKSLVPVTVEIGE